MIAIENVKKIYESASLSQTSQTKTQKKQKQGLVLALAGVSTSINDGEFTAIAGPSGSGKTTLLNLIGCLDAVSNGKILIDGEDVTKMNSKQRNFIRQQKIGFIFQNYNLIPVLTAQENVELALDLLHKFSRSEIKERASEILQEVGLDGLQRRKPVEMSGGQQQRVSIARALVKKPSVILADEPTANLDSKNSCKILELMQSLNEKHNITCLFSTHDNTVMSYCHRIIRLKDGLIIDEGLSDNSQKTN